MRYFLIFSVCFLVLAQSVQAESDEPKCFTGTFTNQAELKPEQLDAYAKKLPDSIHAQVEEHLKNKELIPAVRLIRGCLDINLSSTKAITDRISARLGIQ